MSKKKSSGGFQFVNAVKVTDGIENMLNNGDDDDDDEDKDDLLFLLGLKKTQTHKHDDVLHGKKGYKQQVLPVEPSNNTSNKSQKTKSSSNVPSPTIEGRDRLQIEVDDGFPDEVYMINDDDDDNVVVQPTTSRAGLYKPSYLK